MIFSMAYVMGFAFALSLAVSGFMISSGVGDIPNARSNHSQTIPTCGGLGVVAGLAGLFLLFPHFSPPELLSDKWPHILLLLGAAGLLGFLDDLFTLPALLKFAVLVGLASVAVWLVGPVQTLPFAGTGATLPYGVGFAGSVLWIFVVANAVNFMDGSNGLMPSVMIVACFGLLMIAGQFRSVEAMLIPAGLAAGLLGFLPYNMRRQARIFSGDVGSLFVGFSFAVAVLWLCADVPERRPVFIGPVLIMPFLTDVLLTMIRRLKYKENLLTPHKSHLYQRLISSGMSHIQVALVYSFLGVILAALAYDLANAGLQQITLFLTLPIAILSGVYYAAANKLAKAGF